MDPTLSALNSSFVPEQNLTDYVTLPVEEYLELVRLFCDEHGVIMILNYLPSETTGTRSQLVAIGTVS